MDAGRDSAHNTLTLGLSQIGDMQSLVLKGKNASCQYSFIVSLASRHRLRAGAIIVKCIEESLEGLGLHLHILLVFQEWPSCQIRFAKGRHYFCNTL